MPWRESSVMSERREFCELADAGDVPLAELCRRFGVSRPTGYRWLGRWRAEGVAGLVDRSRRPVWSPARTVGCMELLVLTVREEHPSWGGRKISRRLRDLGFVGVPEPSTVTGILRRWGRLSRLPAPREHQRFEAEAPNDLWQMDFKGDFGLGDGSRCHTFGMLDDHSRFNLALRACIDQTTATVKGVLTDAFDRYGLPWRILCDNGSPWGGAWSTKWTPLAVWLADYDIAVIHSRPYHPQTVGKEERFHGTVDREVLSTRGTWDTLTVVQDAYDNWRAVYNYQRPHDSLALATPISRYRPSTRPRPSRLEPIDYPDSFEVRVVNSGRIAYQGTRYRVPKAFNGRPLGIRPTDGDDTHEIWYRDQVITTITLERS